MQPHVIIHHISDDQFQILRGDGVAISPLVQLPDPATHQVFGWDGCNLPRGLSWYYEKYTDIPAPPGAERAAQVLQALEHWGRLAFKYLFSDPRAQMQLHDARRAGPGWRLRVQSEDGRVLSWPWEALRNDDDPGMLCVNAAVERCIPKLTDPLPLPAGLASDRVRVLLISPRPLQGDVGYRAISGAMVEQVAALPVELTLLRPPTYRALQEALRASSPYHILHFDGHGEQANGGRLLFEDPAGAPDPITAQQLAQLLVHHPVPVVVLSACRSGTLHAERSSPFSGIATTLLKGRIRSVVAMSDVLHRDGAAQFVPAFYRDLMESGSVTHAVMHGRLQMQQNAKRAARGGFVLLQDSILPVVYQNQPIDLVFSTTTTWSKPRPPRRVEWLYRFDTRILTLERALQAKSSLILMRGATAAPAIAQDFMDWLTATGWRGQTNWVDLRIVGSADAALNQMGMMFGQVFFGLDTEEKLQKLAHADTLALTVWDGLEALTRPEDHATLQRLIKALHGGRHHIVATTTVLPTWLSSDACALIDER